MTTVLRRSKLEICIDILRTINDGTASPTRIMYIANLSWKPLMGEYLPLMVKEHLISEADVDTNVDKKRKQSYSLTAKGRDALVEYDRLCELLFCVHAKTVLKTIS